MSNSNIELIKRRTQETLATIGRAALNSWKPDDFDFYICSFELLDSRGSSLELFNFPVMPNTLSIDKQSLVNIKRTGDSINSQFSDSYVSKPISISGSFGRKFKILLGLNNDLKVKTGYGALKMMEKII